MRFEDLLAWQEARVLVKLIYEITVEKSIRSLLYVVLDSFPQFEGKVNTCAEKLNKVGMSITGLLQSTQKRLR